MFTYKLITDCQQFLGNDAEESNLFGSYPSVGTFTVALFGSMKNLRKIYLFIPWNG